MDHLLVDVAVEVGARLERVLLPGFDRWVFMASFPVTPTNSPVALYYQARPLGVRANELLFTI